MFVATARAIVPSEQPAKPLAELNPLFYADLAARRLRRRFCVFGFARLAVPLQFGLPPLDQAAGPGQPGLSAPRKSVHPTNLHVFKGLEDLESPDPKKPGGAAR